MPANKIKIFNSIKIAFSHTFSKDVLLSWAGIKSVFIFFIVMELVSGLVGAVLAIFGVIIGGYDTTNLREFIVSILLIGWMIPFIIAIHRNLLKDEQEKVEVRFFPKLTQTWKIFFTYAGIMAVPFVLYKMLNGGYFGVYSFQYAQLINLLVGFSMLAIAVRLMFVFPVIALQEKASLLQSIKISKGNWCEINCCVSFDRIGY